MFRETAESKEKCGLALRRGSDSLIRQPPPGRNSHTPPHSVMRALLHSTAPARGIYRLVTRPLKGLSCHVLTCSSLWWVHQPAGKATAGTAGAAHPSTRRACPQSKGSCSARRGHGCLGGGPAMGSGGKGAHGDHKGKLGLNRNTLLWAGALRPSTPAGRWKAMGQSNLFAHQRKLPPEAPNLPRSGWGPLSWVRHEPKAE